MLEVLRRPPVPVAAAVLLLLVVLVLVPLMCLNPSILVAPAIPVVPPPANVLVPPMRTSRRRHGGVLGTPHRPGGESSRAPRSPAVRGQWRPGAIGAASSAALTSRSMGCPHVWTTSAPRQAGARGTGRGVDWRHHSTLHRGRTPAAATGVAVGGIVGMRRLRRRRLGATHPAPRRAHGWRHRPPAVRPPPALLRHGVRAVDRPAASGRTPSQAPPYRQQPPRSLGLPPPSSAPSPAAVPLLLLLLFLSPAAVPLLLLL